MAIGAPYKDNGNGPNEGAVYVFTLMGETWTYDKRLTTSDGASGDKFGISVAISRYTLLVGASYKDGHRGAAYVFVLEGDGSWDEGTKIVPVNGIASGDWFGRSVSLYDDRSLIGAVGSDEKGKRSSGAAQLLRGLASSPPLREQSCSSFSILKFSHRILEF